MIRIVSLVILFFLSTFIKVSAQSVSPENNTADHTVAIQIPEVSLVNVTGNSVLQLSLVGPVEAGRPILNQVSDSSFWLNYSFIKGSSSRPSTNIYVRIADGSVPPGTLLSVSAKPYAGNGNGSLGIPSGNVTLTNIEQKLVQDIESSYTGVGVGNGHQMVYSLKVNQSQYQQLDFQSSQQVRLVYTISD